MSETENSTEATLSEVVVRLGQVEQTVANVVPGVIPASQDDVQALITHINNVVAPLAQQVEAIGKIVLDIKSGNYVAATSDGTAEVLNTLGSIGQAVTEAKAAGSAGDDLLDRIKGYFQVNFHLLGQSKPTVQPGLTGVVGKAPVNT